MAEVHDNLELIKRNLIDRKIELEQEMTRLNEEKFADDQVQDAGDQALSSTMDALKESFQDTKRDEYNRIIQALQMIDDGTYGICIDCQLPISQKRLRSYPNATRCLACQEAYEEEGGQEELE